MVFAGLTLEFCSARFRASMDVVSEEIASSRPSVSWGVVVAIEVADGIAQMLVGKDRRLFVTVWSLTRIEFT